MTQTNDLGAPSGVGVDAVVRPICGTATLSLYGPCRFGCGHLTEGESADPADHEKWYRPSVSESLSFFERLLGEFAAKNKCKTGIKIKVTIEAA